MVTWDCECGVRSVVLSNPSHLILCMMIEPLFCCRYILHACTAVLPSGWRWVGPEISGPFLVNFFQTFDQIFSSTPSFQLQAHWEGQPQNLVRIRLRQKKTWPDPSLWYSKEGMDNTELQITSLLGVVVLQKHWHESSCINLELGFLD